MSDDANNFITRVSEWSDFVRLLEHFSTFNGIDWLFRGSNDSNHVLLPKVGRDERKRKQPGGRMPYTLRDERAVFRMFKQQARPHLAQLPRTELEWLALAQHFGVPTRLLDWSDTFAVAAWFAIETPKPDCDSAVWVTRGVPDVESTVSAPSDDPLAYREPHVYRPPHISPRMSAQGSVLMICPDPTSAPVFPFVRQIVIERKLHFVIGKRLNSLGINRRNLFADLSGLGSHLAWLYRNVWLTGYRGPDQQSAED